MKIITNATKVARHGTKIVSIVDLALQRTANSVPLWQTGDDGESLSPRIIKLVFAKLPSGPSA